MRLENLLPDVIINEFIRLGNLDTDTSFSIGDKMRWAWGFLCRKYPEYPKMDFYGDVARFLGGKSRRMVREYYRVATIFPPEERDEFLGFNLHAHACKLENPHKILEIASRQAAKIGEAPTLDWFRRATETEESREETELVHDTEEALLSGSAFYFVNQFVRLMNRLKDSLAELGIEKGKRQRAENLLQELLEIISNEENHLK